MQVVYSGICHSDLHQVKDEWGGSIVRPYFLLEEPCQSTWTWPYAKYHSTDTVQSTGLHVQQYCLNICHILTAAVPVIFVDA